jgi:hypothetical protein
MKKIITLNIFCLFVIMLISSCGTNGSITKRHYTKGYHIAHNKGKHKVNAQKERTNIAHQKTTESTILIPSKEIVKENNSNNAEVVNSIADKSTLTASSSKKPVVIKTQSTAKSLLKSAPVFKIFPSKENKHSFFSKSRPVASDGSGLSLLWIVILVLLILWALGLISGGFGLGGFINILLVIALILLILWLLRII